MAILSLFYYISPTLFFSLFFLNLNPSSCFDVRHHLSTVTRYEAGKEANLLGHQPSSIPDGCTPIHLNLVARHGTRAPTKKRIKELNLLANRLRLLVNEVKQGAKGNALQSVSSWLHEWKSPWEGRRKGEELVSQGESELYKLGIRTRQRFPEIFNEEYHPDVFNIEATQVTRASPSAVAFGIGLFSEKGSLGPGKHRAFSVISESRASDIWLRFHDNCATYKIFESKKI